MELFFGACLCFSFLGSIAFMVKRVQYSGEVFPHSVTVKALPVCLLACAAFFHFFIDGAARSCSARDYSALLPLGLVFHTVGDGLLEYARYQKHYNGLVLVSISAIASFLVGHFVYLYIFSDALLLVPRLLSPKVIFVVLLVDGAEVVLLLRKRSMIAAEKPAKKGSPASTSSFTTWLLVGVVLFYSAVLSTTTMSAVVSDAQNHTTMLGLWLYAVSDIFIFLGAVTEGALSATVWKLVWPLYHVGQVLVTLGLTQHQVL